MNNLKLAYYSILKSFNLIKNDRYLHELRKFLPKEILINSAALNLVSPRISVEPKDKIAVYENGSYDISKKNILIVGHDASRTGVPVLTLNIIKYLTINYNIFTVCFGGGELLPEFVKVSSNTYVLQNKYRFDIPFQLSFFNNYLKKRDFDFAIINSATASCFANVCFENDIPSLLLVHEYSYYLSYQVFRNFFLADKVIFSSHIVKKSFVDQFGNLPYSVDVIPQGDPQIVSSDDSVDESEQIWFDYVKDRAKNFKIIAGLGSCEYRKGIDLFLLAASEILKMNKNTFFIWVGSNLISQNNGHFLRSVIDFEINNFGLRNHFIFIPNLKAFDKLYSFISLVLLTSRLDPLPNVIINSMRNGVPFVSFNQISGVCDIIRDAGLAGICLAKYLDSYDLASKACNLLENSELYANYSRLLLEVYKNKFIFSNYIDKLYIEANAAKFTHSRLINSVNKVLNKDFLYLNTKLFSDTKKGLQSVFNCEIKPYPGFLPALSASSGFLDQNELIAKHENNYTSIKCTELAFHDVYCKVAIHIHVFYLDEFMDIVKRISLNSLSSKITFLISTCKSNFEQVKDILDKYKLRSVVRVCVNKGRDLGPFFTLFKDVIDSFEILGHVHTKKSLGIDRPTIEIWKDAILSSLIGYKDGNTFINMLDRNLCYFVDHDKVGMLFPDDPYVCGWGLNRDAAISLIERIAVRIPDLLSVDQFIFPVGSMFLARYSAIRQFFTLTNDDFPPEPVPYDGTILHAIERTLPFVSKYNKYENVCVFSPTHSRIKY